VHKYFKKKKLKLFHYVYNITSNCKWLILSNSNWFSSKEAIFVGEMSPTASGFRYQIKVVCSEKFYPKIFVTNMNFDGNRPEHLYEDNSLCLYLPSSNEYRPEDLVFPKLIDWTALWLYYYEIWLITDEWYGGGISHTTKDGE